MIRFSSIRIKFKYLYILKKNILIINGYIFNMNIHNFRRYFWRNIFFYIFFSRKTTLFSDTICSYDQSSNKCELPETFQTYR